MGPCSRREGGRAGFPIQWPLVVGALNLRPSHHLLFRKLPICCNHPTGVAQGGCDSRAVAKSRCAARSRLKTSCCFSITWRISGADKLPGFIAAVFFSSPGGRSEETGEQFVVIQPLVTKFEGGRHRYCFRTFFSPPLTLTAEPRSL